MTRKVCSVFARTLASRLSICSCGASALRARSNARRLSGRMAMYPAMLLGASGRAWSYPGGPHRWRRRFPCHVAGCIGVDHVIAVGNRRFDRVHEARVDVNTDVRFHPGAPLDGLLGRSRLCARATYHLKIMLPAGIRGRAGRGNECCCPSRCPP